MTNGIMVCGQLRKDSASKIISFDRLEEPTIVKNITRGWLRGRILT